MANVSVVIPTLGNRPDWRAAVDSALESARACGIETEVILIWQGDELPEAPPSVVVEAIRPIGVSYARNRGAERATAPIVAYIDDDEVVDPTWVGKVVEALADVDAAFGPIEPFGEDGRPHCPTDFGESRIFEPDALPWVVGSGGNMVFRRQALAGLGGFDLRTGPGAIGIAGEETDLIWRLLDGGRRIRWAAEMIVYHPTKSDEEIAASRYPYGFGAGRMLRRSRSPRLIAAYGHAVLHAHLSALRKRDRRAWRESWDFAVGLFGGLSRRLQWVSPELAAAHPPAAVSEALQGAAATPLPVSWGTRPHYLWDCGDAILHAFIGPSEAQLAAPAARELVLAAPGVRGIPPILAHARERDTLWVLEGKVEGEPLGGPASTWWDEAAAFVLSYSRLDGPTFETSPESPRGEAFLEAAPPELRAELEAALGRLAPIATAPCHGDLQPKNLLTARDGIAAIDWEWCSEASVRGLDLVFLAVTHAGIDPDPSVIAALLKGENPAFGDVLGPLAQLGLEGQVLRDTLLVLLVKWAEDERRSIAAFGATPRRPIYGELLQQLTPVLSEGSASRTAAGGIL
ncbi:MAG TPA: glycosyltransferase [Solirubrobacterales bacterium]|nr:glycosyltransferase [Solirubrobacterales bacterium]